MSKCIRGVPWHDTKTKDAGMQNQINKSLDEAERKPVVAEGTFDSSKPLVMSTVKQIQRDLNLPPIISIGETTPAQRAKDPGILASMSKDKLSFDTANINRLYYSKELKRTLARASKDTDKIIRQLNGEKGAPALYNLYAGLYSTRELQMMAHLYHEMGHHLVNYYRNPNGKISNLKKAIMKIDIEVGTPITQSIRARKNNDEWFAENFSYWAMNRYQNEAPIGAPRSILDEKFMRLIREVLDKTL